MLLDVLFAVHHMLAHHMPVLCGRLKQQQHLHCAEEVLTCSCAHSRSDHMYA